MHWFSFEWGAYVSHYSQRASRMNAQLQTFIKYFIHRYEMILRTFTCTIVNQIKSSKKLVVKLKIRNM